MGLGLVLVLAAVHSIFFSEPLAYRLRHVDLIVKDGVDRSYRGRFARDRRILALTGKLPDMRTRALKKAQSKTGLDFNNHEKIVVTLRDTGVFSGFGASSKLVRSGGGVVHLITLSTEQILLGVMDVEKSLVHECIHCIMREMMGESDYLSLPRWIREGVAVWGADQIQERAREVVARAFLEHRHPQEVLASVGDRYDPPDYYLMVALAFKFTAQYVGEKAVRDIIVEIVEGRDPVKAFEDATKLPMALVERRSRMYSQMFFEHILLESGLYEFQEAQRLHDEGYIADAIEMLMVLAVYRPDALLHANAWYWTGRWCFEEQRFPQAALAFNVVIDNFPEHVGLIADSRQWLKTCYRKMSGEEITLVHTILEPQ